MVTVAAVLVAGTFAGCGTGDPRGSVCSGPDVELVEERPVEVPYRGPATDSADVTEPPAPHLVFEVLNNQTSVERVRLTFDGETALDVDLPPGSGCGNGPPVFSVGYDDVGPGPIEVELLLQGEATTTTLDVPEDGTVWAVVDIQSERAWGEITTYDERPGWG